MKKNLFIALFAFFCFSGFVFAQEQTGSLNSGTINSQFDYLNSISNNYQEYKVVKKAHLDKIRQNVTDSLNVFKEDLVTLKQDLKSRQADIAGLKEQMAALEKQLVSAEEARDSFAFLGLPVHKAAYNSFMWTLVAILLGAFLFFLFQYSQSHKVISKARKDLEETREEFDQHRKNTLDRERKLKRELVDALNQKAV
jgi:cell division septum initiation protein DivIVA